MSDKEKQLDCRTCKYFILCNLEKQYLHTVVFKECDEYKPSEVTTNDQRNAD